MSHLPPKLTNQQRERTLAPGGEKRPGPNDATHHSDISRGEFAESQANPASSRSREHTNFTSLLFNGMLDPDIDEQEDRTFASDLNLDQIIDAVASNAQDPDLVTNLFYRHLREADSVYYRQEVFRDLEDRRLRERVKRFAGQMHLVSDHLAQLEQMRYQQQREGWFLDAASIYGDAVRSLAEALNSAQLRSRGLLAFREYLAGYLASSAFSALAHDTHTQQDTLASIRYCIRVRSGRVDVSRYEGQADYSAEVLEAFDRFKQGAVKDYRSRFRPSPGMNHVGGQILELIAQLFSDEFSALAAYCQRHGEFIDRTIGGFARDLPFYLAYLDFISPLGSAGLHFCYPEVSTDSKEIFATETFDLALARLLVAERKPVVPNEFHLNGPERVIVVSGPNQGGKTTFARTFGLLHQLASLGCPIPGRSARLFLIDRVFTQFEREENLDASVGKLEDDIIRVQEILRAATPNSIIILNETFSSTALGDALFLGKKVMEKIVQLDLLAVYVTFVDELSTLGEKVVSMVSNINPADPAERTFKVVRKPADGIAYALAIAKKHHVSYECLHQRLTS